MHRPLFCSHLHMTWTSENIHLQGPQWAAGEFLLQGLVHFLLSPWCSLCYLSSIFVLSTCLHLAFFVFSCFPQEAILLAEGHRCVLQCVSLSWQEPAGPTSPTPVAAAVDIWAPEPSRQGKSEIMVSRSSCGNLVLQTSKQVGNIRFRL